MLCIMLWWRHPEESADPGIHIGLQRFGLLLEHFQTQIHLYCKQRTRNTFMFCWLCNIEYQCDKTNVMHFLFNLLRIKGLYMYRAVLAHPQVVLHNSTWYIAFVSCLLAAARVGVELCSTPTLVAANRHNTHPIYRSGTEFHSNPGSSQQT
jgi:hypothetical protein